MRVQLLTVFAILPLVLGLALVSWAAKDAISVMRVRRPKKKELPAVMRDEAPAGEGDESLLAGKRSKLDGSKRGVARGGGAVGGLLGRVSLQKQQKKPVAVCRPVEGRPVDQVDLSQV